MLIKVNNKLHEFPEGSTAKEVAEKLHLTAPEQAVTVSVNGKLRDFYSKLSD